MANLMQRDKMRRNLTKFYELKRLEYKSILTNHAIPKHIRYKYILKLAQLPRNSSKTRVKNRCVVTGRPRSVYRFCKLSRITLRELGSKGLVLGFKKLSW